MSPLLAQGVVRGQPAALQAELVLLWVSPAWMRGGPTSGSASGCGCQCHAAKRRAAAGGSKLGGSAGRNCSQSCSKENRQH